MIAQSECCIYVLCRVWLFGCHLECGAMIVKTIETVEVFQVRCDLCGRTRKNALSEEDARDVAEQLGWVYMSTRDHVGFIERDYCPECERAIARSVTSDKVDY